jgi:DNA-directed RNA polymerase subunit alpha
MSSNGDDYRRDLEDIRDRLDWVKDFSAVDEFSEINKRLAKIEEDQAGLLRCCFKLAGALEKLGDDLNKFCGAYDKVPAALDSSVKLTAEIDSVLFTPDLPVSALQLSARANNCLANENIRTMRDLLAYSEADLLRLPNFGRVSLQEVKLALAQHGYHLANKRKQTAEILGFQPRKPQLTDVSTDSATSSPPHDDGPGAA